MQPQMRWPLWWTMIAATLLFCAACGDNDHPSTTPDGGGVRQDDTASTDATADAADADASDSENDTGTATDADTTPPCEGLCELRVATGTPGGSGALDGAAAAARFDGIAAMVGDEHWIYLSDADNAAIRRMDRQTHQVTTLAGQLGQPETNWITDGAGSEATFFRPGALALYDGALYVLDGFLLRRIDGPAGDSPVVSTVVDASSGSQWMAFGSQTFVSNALAVAGDRLYISDTSAVWEHDPASGTFTVVAGDVSQSFLIFDGTGTEARFGVIADLVSDGGSTLYVADSCVVRRLDLETGLVQTVAGKTTQGLCLNGLQDGVGTDAEFLEIRRLARRESTLYLLERVPGVSLLPLPLNYGRVRQLDVETLEVTQLAGSIPDSQLLVGDTDGPPLEAHFYDPLSLWADADALWIGTRATVRQLATGGEVATAAGHRYAGALIRPGAVEAVGPWVYVFLESRLQLVRFDTRTQELEAVASRDFNAWPVIASRDMTHLGETVFLADAKALLSYDGQTGNKALLLHFDLLDNTSPCFTSVTTDGESLFVSLEQPCTNATIGALWRVDPQSGQYETLHEGPEWLGAQGLTVAAGMVYFGVNGGLHRFDLEAGQIELYAGSSEERSCEPAVGTTARFGAIGDITADDEAIYLTDWGCHQVWRVDRLTRSVTSLVGQQERVVTTEGFADQAGLNYPRHMTLAPDGSRLYLTDPSDNVLLELGPAEPR